MIVAAFQGEERGAAIGSWTAWGGIAGIARSAHRGPVDRVASWRWIFAINVPLVAFTLAIIFAAVPERRAADATRRLASGRSCARSAWPGRCTPSSASRTRLVDPRGGSSPARRHGRLRRLPGLRARARHPMLALSLFGRRNFAIGNLETFLDVRGPRNPFFFLILFLQQVAGYSPIAPGWRRCPSTIIMFAALTPGGRARRPPRPAPVHGSRADHRGGRATPDFEGRSPMWTTSRELLPALIAVLDRACRCTVAPLTATVLADADEHNAGPRLRDQQRHRACRGADRSRGARRAS